MKTGKRKTHCYGNLIFPKFFVFSILKIILQLNCYLLWDDPKLRDANFSRQNCAAQPETDCGQHFGGLSQNKLHTIKASPISWNTYIYTQSRRDGEPHITILANSDNRHVLLAAFNKRERCRDCGWDEETNSKSHSHSCREPRTQYQKPKPITQAPNTSNQPRAREMEPKLGEMHNLVL